MQPIGIGRTMEPIENDMDMIFEPRKVGNKYVGGQWLGNYKAAQNINVLLENNIDHVYSVISFKSLDSLKQKYEVNNIEHKHLAIEDDLNTNITKHLDQSVEYIEKTLEKGNLLIHCQQGMSRSASMIIAYLIKNDNCDYYKAYYWQKTKRSTVAPNYKFVEQLRNYHKNLPKN